MRRFAAFVVGAVFGLTLSWSGMTDPVVLRDGLLFRDAYLMLFFASALATAFVGMRVLKVLQARALLTGEPVTLDDGRARSAGTSSAACCSARAGRSPTPARGRSRRSSVRASPGAWRRRPGSCSASGCSCAGVR